MATRKTRRAGSTAKAILSEKVQARTFKVQMKHVRRIAKRRRAVLRELAK